MNPVSRHRRWLHDRCAHCGRRFRWRKDARHSFGDNREIFHDSCIGYRIWRSKADERLAMLSVICDVWGISDRDVKGVVEISAQDQAERVKRSDMAFRVFYDLQNSRGEMEAEVERHG